MPPGRRYGHVYRDYEPAPAPGKAVVHTFETELTCSSRCVRPCKRHNFETLMTRWVCPSTSSSASQSPDYRWLDDGAYDDTLEGIPLDRGDKLRINQYFIVLFVLLVLLLLVLVIVVARKCRKRVEL
uniref:Protein UL9 n=1 Tax=Steinernema glaseri TaxID=37863 RepID=A0A1I7YZN5_9BILA